jgi:hypothetical protein
MKFTITYVIQRYITALTFREDNRFIMFENRVLRTILRPEKEAEVCY